MTSKKKKLTVRQFVLKAIEELRTDRSNGIHVVYSGFNQAFREYFPGLNPRDEVDKLVANGTVTTRICKGGAMLYKGKVKVNDAQSVLDKMGV